jgi:hypothetical protein
VSQASPPSTLPPEVQEAVAASRTVQALLDALRTLTAQDGQHWERWQGPQDQIMLPLSIWEAELYVQLRAWGINPLAVTRWGESAALSHWRAAAGAWSERLVRYRSKHDHPITCSITCRTPSPVPLWHAVLQ